MNTAAIEKFIDRYNRAVQGRSKEIRLQINEAESLVHELTILLARTGTLSDKIIELQELIIEMKNAEPSTAINVEMDGGGF